MALPSASRIDLADIVVFGQTVKDEYCNVKKSGSRGGNGQQKDSRNSQDQSRRQSRQWLRGLMRCPETKMFGEGDEGAGTRRCKMAGRGGETYLYLLRLDTRSVRGLRGIAGKT
jgi:hypothetical protein